MTRRARDRHDGCMAGATSAAALLCCGGADEERAMLKMVLLLVSCLPAVAAARSTVPEMVPVQYAAGDPEAEIPPDPFCPPLFVVELLMHPLTGECVKAHTLCELQVLEARGYQLSTTGQCPQP
jgi:hypothetical protein